MDFIGDTSIDWLKYRWYFVALSLTVASIGALDIARKGGLRYGIDFSEGTIVYPRFEKTPRIEEMRQILSNAGIGEAIIQRYDREEMNLVMIRVERRGDDTVELDATANRILDALRNNLADNQLVDVSTEIVGPVVGETLRRQARNATLFAMVAMFVYIGFRFEPIYGVGATVAVFHDVVLTLGLVSVFNHEISLNVIAAFLFLVGYSVNDTIVIFDRVRENRQLARRTSLREIMNLSINQTLRRTILTSGLTFFAVVALYALGGEVLRGFSFVLVAGIIIGTYSSIAIASPIVLWWRRYRDRPASQRRKAKAKPEERAARV
ncbi:MAG TPA: protein translocase subunit SecF [Vicinamibacteria bacterium]|nr:protein translocase subunit SecF [Vicinamibacteria bacterium]